MQDKVASFARSRRDLALAMARKHNVEMPSDVEDFFKAVESGDWERIKSTFTTINGGDTTASFNANRSEAAHKMWPAIIDAFGAAEQAHLWPAESLLDYGYSILDSLKPGQVYVGGTDSSRWVPALLNDTEEGSPHVVITQNGFADGTYIDYMQLQFDGRMKTLTQEDSAEAFQSYIQDAQQRYEHDKNFPDEPKQVRQLEELKMVDNRFEVSGKVAVFDINERLLSKLKEKNPELSFAIGESVPLKGTYKDALPSGHLMELGAGSKQDFTSERAIESVNFWQQKAETILTDPTASKSNEALKSYSHDAAAAANLLGSHEFHEEAEQAYRLAQKLWPANPEVALHLFELNKRMGRPEQGEKILSDFARAYPEEAKVLTREFGVKLPE